MMSRRIKAGYYLLAGPILRVNGWLYRRLRAPRSGSVRVQLGPGQKNYLEGWINVDANRFTARCDVWADLRNPLPFRTGTLDAVYSHHVIEHLPDLEGHVREVFRCLKPGGVYRVGGPNGDAAVARLLARDAAWFPDFPDARRSVGGRFENFIFCRREHVTMLTHSYLDELLTGAGFESVRRCLPVRETNHPDLFRQCLGTEYESDFEHPHTLIVEAEKPGPRVPEAIGAVRVGVGVPAPKYLSRKAGATRGSGSRSAA
jgi:predicted SAM-dependent methyltransferase